MSKNISSIVKKEVTDIIGEHFFWNTNVLYKSLMTREENKVTDDGIIEEEHVKV